MSPNVQAGRRSVAGGANAARGCGLLVTALDNGFRHCKRVGRYAQLITEAFVFVDFS